MHRRAFHAATATAVLIVICSFGTAAAAGAAGVSTPRPRNSGPAHPVCAWTTPAETANLTPGQLAAQVLARMDVTEKLSLTALRYAQGFENETPAIPQLCIPALTLQDGPDGVGYLATDVTQLPASIGVAASFNTDLAYSYGVVEGAEARAKGIDVLQGPNLNLARVANDGRIFEGYGEDPNLVSAMGVADIEGIQSEGVMADAKHFSVYNQETDRFDLNQVVSPRALNELYLAPFRAAVEQGHVASLMCAFGKLNGVWTCANQQLLLDLKEWGFQGFMRSDLGAVTNPASALSAGVGLLKPFTPAQLDEDSLAELRDAVLDGSLTMTSLNAVVTAMLTEMFAYGLIQNPRPASLDAHAATPAHTAFARSSAEQSMVLLKDDGGVLPLDPASAGSVAVIGADAANDALASGSGGSYVEPPFLRTPLASLRGALTDSAVTYSPGGEYFGALPSIPPSAVRRLAEQRGLKGGVAIERGIPRVERDGLMTMDETVVAPRSGLYSISLSDESATWLFANDRLLLASPGPHGPMQWDSALALRAGRPVTFTIVWSTKFLASVDDPSRASVPSLGWQDDTPSMLRAVALAKRARTAIVFVGALSQEGADRPTLSLMGDEDALVDAVAGVNPRTVVVVNSGGAVLMPWLDKVAGVLEAWYPGEEDGPATAAVLTGAYDPSGHLPVTFPASLSQTPVANPAAFPGIHDTVDYSEDLDVGYRYFEATGEQPLFPFGFGLSYSTFSFSHLAVAPSGTGYEVSVDVTNAGTREGREAVQLYVGFPTASDEPPLQLKGFASVDLAPGETAPVSLSLSRNDLASYLDNGFVVEPGTYGLHVGDSFANLPLSANIAVPAAPAVSPLGAPDPLS